MLDAITCKIHTWGWIFFQVYERRDIYFRIYLSSFNNGYNVLTIGG